MTLGMGGGQTAARIASICTALVSLQAHAATPPGESLEAVIVTGQRLEETLPQQLAQYGTKVDTISAEQIQNGGYLDIAATLQSLVPGLYVASKNGPFDYVDISLQGSRSKDVLWLVDGVRINNRLYGGTAPLDTLSAGMVERIEVLDGGQALFYGTQATAGAVNIVTKSFSKSPQGSFSIGADTNQGRHLDAYFRDAIGDHQFVLYGSNDQSTGFQPFRDVDYQPSATDRQRSYNVFNVGAKYAYEFSDALRFETLYQHTDGKLDYAGPAYTATAFNERDEDLISAKVDYTMNDAVQLFVKGYGHWWRSHYTEFDNVIGSPGALEVIDDHDFWGYKDYGLNMMAKFSLNSGFEYLAGYDFQNYSGNDAVLVITDKTERVNALFAQVRTTSDLLPRAHMAVGVRYNDPSVGPAATVWNASGKFDLPDHWFARLSAGTSFRLPTAEELFADDPNDERGNPNLKPEQGRNLNVSVGGQLGAVAPLLNWELIGFFRNIRNLITIDGFDAATNQSVAENIAGTVRVRGVEFDLNAALSDTVSGQLSAIYNQSRQQGEQQLTRIPVRQYKTMLDYHPANLPLGATVTINHVGTVYASVWDGREPYGDYTVVDLAGRIFIDTARRNSINIRVENLFDKQYASLLGTTQRDADGSDYTYWHLGVPRTLSIRYSHQF
jgi:vitamin B12 transporter